MMAVCDTVESRLDSEDWEERKHPRDEGGKFSKGIGGSSPKKSAVHGLMKSTIGEDGKRYTESGSDLPEHIQKLKIPPAWTDVHYSESPNDKLLAIGKDAKGREQRVYSKEFSESQSRQKFARINSMLEQFDSLIDQNSRDMTSDSITKRDAAACTALIMSLGIRPGSESDTGAEKKAFGATTLKGEHVKIDEDGSVSLKFVGKKGVNLSIPVEDEAIARMLINRKKSAGDNGQLFLINERQLLDHVHSLDHGNFKTKDFRTLLGTRTAIGIINKFPKPNSQKDREKLVKQVAVEVARKLGNTPIVALQSYIDPSVFSAWGA
jgi:DNA topoisomerase-1